MHMEIILRVGGLLAHSLASLVGCKYAMVTRQVR